MMLVGNKLSKRYASGKVLDQVSIEVAAGQVCGLLGRNGAGKTTLFKILCGLIKPDEGMVQVHSKRKKTVGGIIERPGLYPYLSAYDNLKIFAGIQGASSDESSIRSYLSKVGLPLDRRDPVRNFSLGMKQRLGIAIALLNDPECLVLDEPFSGLDPIGVVSLIELIRHLALDEGIAILISSHMLAELSRCCDFLYVIEEGKVVNKGTSAQLIREHIRTFHLVADDIARSVTLQKYQVTLGQHEARVWCDATEIPLLLQELLTEGIAVTACTPEINLEQLINKT